MPESDGSTGFKALTAITILVLICLFTAFIWHLAWQNGKAEGEYAANSDTYARHAQEQIKMCFALAEDAAKAECVSEVVNTHNEQERAEADLVAQTEMGLWALGMLIVTAAMALVTGLGVYYVWRTLKATQEMARDTRDIGTAQTRPWLSVDMGIGSDLSFGDDEAKIVIDVTIKNHGNSPAVGVFVDVEAVSTSVGSIGLLEQMRLRPFITNRKRSTYGFRIFPNQQHLYRIKIPIPLGKEASERVMVSPVVMCSIRYQTPGRTNGGHFTDVAMHLVDVESGMGLGISPKHGDIPARRLQLQKGFGQGAVE